MRTSTDNSGLPKHGKKMKLNALFECAVSSVVEHYLDTVGVTGSNPVSRTISEYSSGRGTPRHTVTIPLCLQWFYRHLHSLPLRQVMPPIDPLRLKFVRLFVRLDKPVFQPHSAMGAKMRQCDQSGVAILQDARGDLSEPQRRFRRRDGNRRDGKPVCSIRRLTIGRRWWIA